MSKITVDPEKIAKRVIKKLDKTYHLNYADYDDSLTDEQIRSICSGDLSNICDVENAIDEERDDINYEYFRDYELKELVPNAVERAALLLDQGCETPIGDIWDAIRERDESSMFMELLRVTNDKLWRYKVEWELPEQCEADRSGSATEKRAIAAASIAKAIGVDTKDNYNATAIASMLENSYAMDGDSVELFVIWYDDAKHTLMPILNTAWGNDEAPSHITWKDPKLVLLNRWSGSGDDCPIVGEVTLPFDPAATSLDYEESGYGWDQVAGVVKRYYDNRPSYTRYHSPDGCAECLALLQGVSA